MLIDTRRALERDRLTVYAAVPPKVEYALTELGASLFEPPSTLCQWAEQCPREVQAARARYRDDSST